MHFVPTRDLSVRFFSAEECITQSPDEQWEPIDQDISFQIANVAKRQKSVF